MDAFALSTTFATIVGLLATFQSIDSEKKKEKDLSGFVEWLHKTNNENTAAIIENDVALQRQLSEFIGQNHDEVMSQLSTLNDLMVSIASRIKGLDSLASTFQSNNGLSDQAVDVLRQFVTSDSKNMHHLQDLSEDGDSYILEGAPEIQYSESRFIEDDINSLVDTGLINLTIASRGGKVYKITRQAIAFINHIDGSE